MSSFAGPVLPCNQILYLHHFNLKSLYLQPPQSVPNWIQFHMLETSPAVSTPFQSIGNKDTFFCYSLLSGQFQLKLFYCGDVTLYPCECSLQNPLILRWTESFTPIFFIAYYNGCASIYSQAMSWVPLRDELQWNILIPVLIYRNESMHSNAIGLKPTEWKTYILLMRLAFIPCEYCIMLFFQERGTLS